MPDDAPESATEAGLGSARLLRPLCDVRPVPRRSATYGPARGRQDAAAAPDVHGGPLDPQPLGYLGDAHGVAIGHEKTVAKVLTDDQGCSDNQYMTQTQSTRRVRYNVQVISRNLAGTVHESSVKVLAHSAEQAQAQVEASLVGLVQVTGVTR